MHKDRTIDTELCLRTDRMVLKTFTDFIEDLSRQNQGYLNELYNSEEFNGFARWSHRLTDDAKFTKECAALTRGETDVN